MRGKIRKLIRDRGFGFILAEDGREVFFHLSDLEQASFESLEEEDRVEFNVDNTPKGTRARNVRIITSDEGN